MVALCQSAEHLLEPLPRARGQSSNCDSDVSRFSKSRQYTRLRPSTYGGPIRLVVCSKDPIGYVDGDWSLYEYVSGLPLIAVDPDGRSTVVAGGAVGGAVAGGAGVAVGAAAGAVAIAALAVCMGPHFKMVQYAQRRGEWGNDKYAHCVVSCRSAKMCGNLISAVGGLSFEVLQAVQKALGSKRTDGFSLGDVAANGGGVACAGWEATCPVIGPLLGLPFRDSCADCCDEKYGAW